MKLLTMVLFVSLLGLEMAVAQEVTTTTEDSLVAKAAKEKSYPGGRDEEDLEVQPQVIKPVRKMGAPQENAESPSNDDEF
jgi:hypothetical protein